MSKYGPWVRDIKSCAQWKVHTNPRPMRSEGRPMVLYSSTRIICKVPYTHIDVLCVRPKRDFNLRIHQHNNCPRFRALCARSRELIGPTRKYHIIFTFCIFPRTDRTSSRSTDPLVPWTHGSHFRTDGSKRTMPCIRV